MVDAELDKLLEEEKALRSKLHFAEEESKATQREITKVKAEVEELRKNEHELEREYAKLKVKIIFFTQKYHVKKNADVTECLRHENKE